MLWVNEQSHLETADLGRPRISMKLSGKKRPLESTTSNYFEPVLVTKARPNGGLHFIPYIFNPSMVRYHPQTESMEVVCAE